MGQHAVEVQRADVLDKVQRVGVVSCVRGDRIGIMIDARYHLGKLIAMQAGRLNARAGTASAAKEVYVEKSDHSFCLSVFGQPSHKRGAFVFRSR